MIMNRIPENEEAILGKDAEWYAKHHSVELMRWIYKPILEMIQAMDKREGRFLEIGAGPGHLAGLMLETFPEIRLTAVDISADMANIARKHFQSKKMEEQIDYRIGDAGDDRFVAEFEEKFDVIYSTFSLHHWKDPQKMFDNLLQLLKDDGLIIVYDFKRVWWMYYLPINSPDIKQVQAAYTAGELRRLLGRARIPKYQIKTYFPYFFQAAVCQK